MIKIALDMDDVLAATHDKLIDYVLNHLDTDVAEADFHQDSFENLLSVKEMKQVHSVLNTPGFFRTIPLIDGAQEAVYELSKHYEIYIASAAMEFRESFKDKFDWLDEHFPFIPWTNRIFCGDKSILYTDYLIDDSVRNIATFKANGILFTAPSNLRENRFVRADNWEEVKKMLL